MVTKRGKMLSKRAKIAETTPETTKKATKTKRRKLTEEEEEDETPLTGILCLKQRQDMKVFEEKEDCFILDFDPNDSFDHSKELSSSDNPEGDDDDVAIVHEKGQFFFWMESGAFRLPVGTSHIQGISARNILLKQLITYFIVISATVIKGGKKVAAFAEAVPTEAKGLLLTEFGFPMAEA
ncbi:hypothetical protein Bca4012_022951 [Brassica carinata]